MSEASERLKARAENFAVGVVKFCETLPNTIAGRKIAGQLIDASTSVAANYRAACRGLYSSDFRIEARHRGRRGRRKRAVAPHHPAAPACSPLPPLDLGARGARTGVNFHRLPSNRARPAQSAPPGLCASLILQSTIFNPTTICKSNNLRIFQFCEGLEAGQPWRGGPRLSWASVQS